MTMPIDRIHDGTFNYGRHAGQAARETPAFLGAGAARPARPALRLVPSRPAAVPLTPARQARQAREAGIAEVRALMREMEALERKIALRGYAIAIAEIALRGAARKRA